MERLLNMQRRACRSLQSVGMETLGISLRVVEVEKPSHIATCSSLIQRLHKLRQREKSQSLMDWHMQVIRVIAEVSMNTRDWEATEERQGLLEERGSV